MLSEIDKSFNISLIIHSLDLPQAEADEQLEFAIFTQCAGGAINLVHKLYIQTPYTSYFATLETVAAAIAKGRVHAGCRVVKLLLQIVLKELFDFSYKKLSIINESFQSFNKSSSKSLTKIIPDIQIASEET